MNLKLYIENLGAIEKAELTVNPLTILAGENGTGKSFVTKFLYSVLNAVSLNKNYNIINALIHESMENVQIILAYFEKIPTNRINELEYLKALNRFLSKNLPNISVSNSLITVNTKSKDFSPFFHHTKKYLEIIDSYFEMDKDAIENKTVDSKNFSESFMYIDAKMRSKFLYKQLNDIIELMTDFRQFYRNLIIEYLPVEIKGNFQTSNIKNLIKFGAQKLVFNIENLISLEINSNEGLVINELNLENVESLKNSLFIESATYWRLSRLIDERKKQVAGREILTGVPKHFIDLKEQLFVDYLDDDKRPVFIIESYKQLKNSLKGSFLISNNDLFFENQYGENIEKSLISFGMTHLGIIQLLLSKNIINKGSFVFIDEPESNLHPEWQAVLAKILVKLAENGVFVVITTHSSDMLKALDVYTSDLQQENFISTNYFEKDGTLTVFDKEDINNVGKLALVRNKLLEPYAFLTFEKKGLFE